MFRDSVSDFEINSEKKGTMMKRNVNLSWNNVYFFLDSEDHSEGKKEKKESRSKTKLVD